MPCRWETKSAKYLTNCDRIYLKNDSCYPSWIMLWVIVLVICTAGVDFSGGEVSGERTIVLPLHFFRSSISIDIRSPLPRVCSDDQRSPVCRTRPQDTQGCGAQCRNQTPTILAGAPSSTRIRFQSPTGTICSSLATAVSAIRMHLPQPKSRKTTRVASSAGTSRSARHWYTGTHRAARKACIFQSGQRHEAWSPPDQRDRRAGEDQ